MLSVPINFRFLDKLKLYNDFISKRSIYQNKLWDECQAILAWAASPNHRHLGSCIKNENVLSIFGYENRGNSVKEAINDSDIPKEIEFRKKVIKKLKDDNFAEVSPIIGNLLAMSFGYRPKDFDPDPNKTGIAVIRFNQKGYLMGELILELNKNNLIKYKYVFFNFILKLILFLSISALLLSLFYYLFDNFIIHVWKFLANLENILFFKLFNIKFLLEFLYSILKILG